MPNRTRLGNGAMDRIQEIHLDRTADCRVGAEGQANGERFSISHPCWWTYFSVRPTMAVGATTFPTAVSMSRKANFQTAFVIQS